MYGGQHTLALPNQRLVARNVGATIYQYSLKTVLPPSLLKSSYLLQH